METMKLINEIIILLNKIIEYRKNNKVKNWDVLNLNSDIQIVFGDWRKSFWIFWGEDLLLETIEDSAVNLSYDKEKFDIIHALIKRRAIKYGVR